MTGGSTHKKAEQNYACDDPQYFNQIVGHITRLKSLLYMAVGCNARLYDALMRITDIGEDPEEKPHKLIRERLPEQNGEAGVVLAVFAVIISGGFVYSLMANYNPGQMHFIKPAFVQVVVSIVMMIITWRGMHQLSKVLDERLMESDLVTKIALEKNCVDRFVSSIPGLVRPLFRKPKSLKESITLVASNIDWFLSSEDRFLKTSIIWRTFFLNSLALVLGLFVSMVISDSVGVAMLLMMLIVPYLFLHRMRILMISRMLKYFEHQLDMPG